MASEEAQRRENQFTEIGSLVFVNKVYSFRSTLSKGELQNECREAMSALFGNYFSSSAEVRNEIDVKLDYINHVCDVLAIFPDGTNLMKDDVIGNLYRFSKSELVPNSYRVY